MVKIEVDNLLHELVCGDCGTHRKYFYTVYTVDFRMLFINCHIIFYLVKLPLAKKPKPQSIFTKDK